MNSIIAQERLTTAMAMIQEAQAIILHVSTAMMEETPEEMTTFDPNDYKRPDGKMTETGAKLIEECFESGMDAGEVAKRFKIGYGSAIHRFQKWKLGTMKIAA